MVTKNCPQCEKQLPIASRICACGHSFTKEKPNQAIAPEPTISSSRPRRTITRRPNLYSQVRPRQLNKPRVAPVARQPAHKQAKLLKTEESTNKEEELLNKGRSRAQSEPVQRIAPGLMEDSPKMRRARFRTLSSVFEQDASVSNSENSSTSSTSGSRDEDMYSNLPADKVMQYSIILDEINRKYMGQNFKPS